MQMDLKYGVRAASILFHSRNITAARLLKPSPKGEGFSPPSV
jgi:hypothetical protein